MIRVLITDDHRLVRAGFRRLLEDEPDMQVVGEAGSAQEALDFVRSHSVDVVLLDISMPPGETGLQVLPKLRKAVPDLCVLVVSMNSDRSTSEHALKVGARAYLTKDRAAEELIGAIRKGWGGS